MEAALGWIGDFFRFFFALLPRLVIVKATHEGVKFVRGKRVVRIGPGLHWYWPLVTEVIVVAIKRQTVNLPTQRLIDRDGKTIVVSGIVVYEVSDVVALLTACWNYDQTIRDMSLAAVKDVVVSMGLQELLDPDLKIEEELEQQLAPELALFGIRVIRLTLSDLAPATVLAHCGLEELPFGQHADD